MALSFENTNTSNVNNTSSGQLSFGANAEKPKETSVPQLKGNPIGNASRDLNEISAGITSLIGAIFGYDKEARQGIVNLYNQIQNDPTQVKQLADAMLNTYNLSMDDFGSMPLGEMVGNVMTGAWEHPVSAFLDFAPIFNMVKGANASSKAGKVSKTSEILNKVDDMDARIRLAEEVTKENVSLANIGQDFLKSVGRIEATYSPEIVSKAMQAIETVGFKNAPKELIPAMQDLSKTNDIYKQFTRMAGADIIDDVEMATRELISKEYKIPFAETNKLSKDTKLYKDVEQYVVDNDVKPLFHLKPKVYADLVSDTEKIETSLLKRKFGTMDYTDASKDLGKKASEFIDKVVGTTTRDSAENLNKKIVQFNKETGRNLKQLEGTGNLFRNNRFLNELNSELKKTMLGGGVYLGANVLTTTLSVLNNFDLKALAKTFKELPKFRMVELAEAKTPILNYISKLNNTTYRPIASVDRYLEAIAIKYIENYGLDKAKYLQSAIPSKAVITNPVLNAMKQLVPFGSYPAAAIQEVGAHITGKPGKVLALNQLQKAGQDINVRAQQAAGLEPDTTKAVRLYEQGNQIQRNTIVTPIQAANMFMFGERGDAIQVPIFQFLNKLISGKGDPNVFEVNGRTYKVENGKVKTSKGDFDLLPSLAYAGRSLLTPVQFYNQVITPLMSDKYIRDESKLLNQMVSDSQYSNLGARAQRKVTDKAKEKLGKRLLGTYEYNYYDDRKISKSIQRRVKSQYRTKRQLNEALK